MPIYIAIVLLILLPALAAPLHAATLEPYQQAALERILATMDAETQAFARPQLEQMLGSMDEAEVRMIVSAMLEQAPDNPPEAADAVESEPTASAEDLDFNRSQYEPALRSAWQASHEFDRFVDAKLAQHCPSRDAFAVYGAGWRYEVAPMQPTWIRAADNPDLEIQVLGSSYAPQDGRYHFDFSGMRNEFDKARVEQAIKQSCSEYKAVGDAFMADARANLQDDMLPNGFELENAANARAFALISALGDALTALGPAGNAPILNALLSGTRVE